MKSCSIVVLAGLLVPGPVFAQARDLPPQRLIISDRAIAAALKDHPPAPPVQSSRDSLGNGAMIGAVIGGIAMGGFVTWLCHQLKEPGDPSCWKSTLYAGALGAGAGAVAGLGIDAMAFRSAPEAPAARVAPIGPRR